MCGTVSIPNKLPLGPFLDTWRGPNLSLPTPRRNDLLESTPISFSPAVLLPLYVYVMLAVIHPRHVPVVVHDASRPRHLNRRSFLGLGAGVQIRPHHSRHNLFVRFHDGVSPHPWMARKIPVQCPLAPRTVNRPPQLFRSTSPHLYVLLSIPAEIRRQKSPGAPCWSVFQGGPSLTQLKRTGTLRLLR